MPREIIQDLSYTTYKTISMEEYIELYVRPESWSTTKGIEMRYTGISYGNTHGLRCHKWFGVVLDIFEKFKTARRNGVLWIPLGVPLDDDAEWFLQNQFAFKWADADNRGINSDPWAVYVHSTMEAIQTLVYSSSINLAEGQPKLFVKKVDAVLSLIAQMQYFADRPWYGQKSKVRTLLENVETFDELSDTIQKYVAAIILHGSADRKTLGEMVVTAKNRRAKNIAYGFKQPTVSSMFGLLVLMPLIQTYYSNPSARTNEDRARAVRGDAKNVLECMGKMTCDSKRDAMMVDVFMNGGISKEMRARLLM
jgi:hypothetical protein